MRDAERWGNMLYCPRTGRPISLAMQRMEMTGSVTPAGGVLTILHSFKCEEKDPMEAAYIFQLPRNGAIRRFRVRGEDFDVESVLSPRAEARKEYEKGVQGGHLSTLAETSLDGVVTLMVGQVQPEETVTVAIEVVSGVELRDGSYRFRFPFTMSPNYHHKASVSSTGSGMKVNLPPDVFGELVLPEFKTDATNLHEVSFRLHVESMGQLATISSPSHNITVQPNQDGSADVWLASLSSKPDKDLVLDVATQVATPVVFADASLVKDAPVTSTFPAGSPRWSATIPSELIPKGTDLPRKVLFLLDVSRSMEGNRLQQAKTALTALLSAMTPTDMFGLVAFSDNQNAFHDAMAPATDTNRARAARWLKQIEVVGGTELLSGLSKAVEVLDGPGDVFLMTDGEVAETGDIVTQTEMAGCRVHILGIGEASQDRFLAQLSRRTGGVQKMMNPSENVTEGALELFNAVKCPRQTGVKAIVVSAGATQTHDIGEVWDGRPILITDSGISGDRLPTEVGLVWGVSQNTKVDLKGTYREMADGMVALLWAGRQIEDLETSLDAVKNGPAKTTLNKSLVDVSTNYGLASRAMSLSAVVKRVGDQAGVTPIQKTVAVGMPSDMVGQAKQALNCLLVGHSSVTRSFSGVSYLSAAPVTYGSSFSGGSVLRSSGNLTKSSSSGTWVNTADCSNDTLGEAAACSFNDCDDSPDMERSLRSDVDYAPSNSIRQRLYSKSAWASPKLGGDDNSRGIQIGAQSVHPATTMAQEAHALMQAIGSLQADGGLPGYDATERVLKTALLGLVLLQKTIDSKTSMYKAHLKRIASFLKGHTEESSYSHFLAAMFETASVKMEGNWWDVYKGAQTMTTDELTHVSLRIFSASVTAGMPVVDNPGATTASVA